MVSQNDIEKLRRFCEGIADNEEVKYIYSLFTQNKNSQELEQQIRKEFFEYVKKNPDADYNLSYLLDRIHHIIHKNENRKEYSMVKKIYRWYSFAAAVLFIPILIFTGLWFREQPPEKNVATEKSVVTTIFAPLGSRINFTLPDGTIGWLNSGSSLEYNTPFNKNRNVTILGEAWFDVAHDEAHPFAIKAGDSKIKVLGTKFNLNAYPAEKYVEVVLEEGIVEFRAPNMASAVELHPLERLVYTRDSIHIGKADPIKYSAWVEGKLVFRNDPMPEVARRIARWYNVEVELTDRELEKDVIRGTFQDDSLEDVLRYLSMSTPIRYRIEDLRIGDDQTFLKKKVFLYKKKV